MGRVLVTEKLAQPGLDLMSAAGHEVDVQLGLTPEQLVEAIVGANALVIRSATTVTAEVLAAGTDLVVVGRAGIGLDNVDVAAATERGVMVVNAPSRTSCRPPSRPWPCCWPRPATSPRPTPPWWPASGSGPSGRASSSTARPSASSASAGSAPWWPSGPWPSACAWSPTTPSCRPTGPGTWAWSSWTSTQLMAESDFVTVHLPKNKETLGLIGADMLAKAKPGLRIINTARGGIVDEDALADAIRNGHVQGAGLDVFAKEPTTESPLFELPSVIVAPHLGASTVEAQDKAGVTIAEQVILALAGDFVPFAVNVNATDVSETVRPFMGLAEQLGRILVVHGGRPARHARDRVPGRPRRCRHRHPHPVGAEGPVRRGHRRAGVLRERPAAGRRAGPRGPRGLDRHGPRLRQPDHPAQRRPLGGRHPGRHQGRAAPGHDGRPHGRGAARPPTWWWCATTTGPGMIGVVGTILGDADVSISSMAVGPSATGNTALMVLSTDGQIPDDALHRLRDAEGISDVHTVRT